MYGPGLLLRTTLVGIGRYHCPRKVTRKQRDRDLKDGVIRPSAKLQMMKNAEVKAIIGAIAAWAVRRDDIRAMALIGSWARGNPQQTSDIDLLLLSDHHDEYRRRRKWLTEIDFKRAGFQLRSSNTVVYGVAWSRHLHLLPAAEVELTFAKCSWARTHPIEAGTRVVVKDALRIILDKDRSLAKLTATFD